MHFFCLPLLFLAVFPNHVLATTAAQASVTIYSNSSDLASPITAAPATTACVTCAVFCLLEISLWWTETLPLTLDTVQYLVTQYNNTALTNTQTIHGNFSTLEVLSVLPSSLIIAWEEVFELYDHYPQLTNATTLAENNNSITMTSGTPYYVYDAVTILTGNAEGSTYGIGNGTSLCLSSSDFEENNPFLDLNTIVPLKSPLFQTVPVADRNFSWDIVDDPFSMPSDFYNYILSDPVVLSAYPDISNCEALFGSGAPFLLVPVSTLTASETSTIKNAAFYSTAIADTTGASSNVPPSPSPAVQAPGPPATSTTPQSSPTIAPPESSSRNPSPSATGADNEPPATSTSVADNKPSPIDTINTHSGPPTSSLIATSNVPSASAPRNPPLASSDTGNSGESLSAPITSSNPLSGAGKSSLSNSPSEQSFPVSSNAVGGETAANQQADSSPSVSNLGTSPNTNSITADEGTPLPLPIITIGTSTYEANSNSEYNVAGQMLAPGSSAITVDNVPYSLGPLATQINVGGSTINIALAVFGSSTIALSSQRTYANPVLTIAGELHTADAASNYILGSQTLMPGGPAVTVSNTPYSLAPSLAALVAGTSTIALSPQISYPPQVLTVAGGLYTANAASNYIIGFQTLIPGGPALTISGTSYSLAPSAAVLFAGTSTINLSTQETHPPHVLTVAGQLYTANSASDYMIGSQILIPGGSAVTISGIPYSLAPSGDIFVSGTSTIAVSDQNNYPPIALSSVGQLVAGSTGSDFVIGSRTLNPGGPAVTISNTCYSLAPSAAALVIGSSTSILASQPQSAASDFVVGGQTLSPGSEITVSGTRISLAAQETDVVVGSSTESVGIGGLIVSGFGGGVVGSESATAVATGTSVEGFTGQGSRKGVDRRILVSVMATVLFMFCIFLL